MEGIGLALPCGMAPSNRMVSEPRLPQVSEGRTLCTPWQQHLRNWGGSLKGGRDGLQGSTPPRTPLPAKLWFFCTVGKSTDALVSPSRLAREASALDDAGV